MKDVNLKERKRKKRSMGKSMLSFALTFVLLFGCIGAMPAFATENDTPVVVDPELPANTVEAQEENEDAIPYDITSYWASGAYVIDKAGRYYLSDDIATNGTLYINAPEGETITFDFAGYTASVNGVVTSGIDASLSKGNVVITDSVAKNIDAEKAKTFRNLKVEAVKVGGAVSGIIWNLTEESKDFSQNIEITNIDISVGLNTLDAGVNTGLKHDAYGVYLGYGYDANEKPINATITNSSFDVSVNNFILTDSEESKLIAEYAERTLSEDESGVAVAIMTSASGVKLAGKITSNTSSKGGISDLYSIVDAAFTIAQSFETPDPLVVFSNGNEENIIFAYLEARRIADGELLASFIDGSANGYVCVADDQGLFFNKPEPEIIEDEVIEDEVDDKKTSEELIDEQAGLVKPAQSELGMVFPMEAEDDSSLSTVINLDWTDTSVRYNITEGGVYEFTSNFNAAQNIYINAPGKEVTIKFNGYTFNSTLENSNMIHIQSAGSVTIDGKGSGGNGKLLWSPSASENTATADRPSGGIYEAAPANAPATLNVRNLDIVIKRDTQGTRTATYSGTRGLNVVGGDVTVENCNIDYDLTNLNSTTATTFFGVNIGTSVKSFSISNSNVNATATRGSNSTTYALYSTSTGNVVVKGGEYSATCTSGSATVMYGPNISLENSGDLGLDLKAVAGTNAIGIQSTSANGILLDSKTSIVLEGAKFSSLYSNVTNKTAPFEIGSSFEISEETVWDVIISPTFAAASSTNSNTAGTYFVSFADSLSDAKKEKAETLFNNPYSQDSPIIMARTESGLLFTSDPDNPYAIIVHEDTSTSPYASAADALASIKTNETLKLIKPVPGGITILSALLSIDDSITIDLNGQEIGYIDVTTPGTVTVINTDEDTANTPLITGSSAANGYAVRLNSPAINVVAGNLIINNIDISTKLSGTAANTGVILNAGTGTLRLNGCEVNIEHTAQVYGIASTNTQFLGKTYVSDCKINITGGNNSRVASVFGKMTFSDCELKLLASGATAYGIYINATSESEISNTNLSVEGGTTAYGVYAMGNSTFTAKGSESLNTIECKAGTNEYAVASLRTAAQSAPAISLSNYNILTAKGVFESETVWSFVTNPTTHNVSNPRGSANANLTLDGVCNFNSPLGLGASPIKLGSNFSSSEEASIVVANRTGALAGAGVLVSDIFAVASDEVSDISDSSKYFVAMENYDGLVDGFGFPYSGWEISGIEKNSKLVWTNDGDYLVINLDKDKGYSFLSAAISDAEDGNKIQLLDNVFTPAIAIDKPLMLDLNEKSLTVNATGSVVTNGAIRYTGDGELKLSNGSVEINVGGNENATYDYIGIANNGIGTVIFDKTSTTVNFTRAYTGSTPPSITLYGILASKGNVSLQTNSSLIVNANKNQSNGFGAKDVYGIFVDGEEIDSDRLTISSDSSVEVSNDTARVERGSMHSSSSFDQAQTFSLKEINLEKDSDLYSKIQTEFYNNAKFDGPSGQDSVYGARIYYLSPLEIDDVLYFAFSDIVPEGEENDPKHVVATRVFVQSRYTVPSASYGVSVASGTEGDIIIEGTVFVNSLNGDATAINAQGNGNLTIDGAVISAKGSDMAYPVVDNSVENGLGVSDNPRAFYRSNSRSGSADFVVEKSSDAIGISTSESSSVLLSGEIDITTEGMSQYDIYSGSLIIGDSLSSANDSPWTVEKHGGNISGDSFAIPSENVTISNNHRTLFVDANGKLTIGVSEVGLVWDNLYSIAFYDGETQIKVESDKQYGESVILPDKETIKKAPTATNSYTFVGWSKDKNATEMNTEKGDISVDETVVIADSSVTYYAIFEEGPLKAVVTFRGIKNSDGGDVTSVSEVVNAGMKLKNNPPEVPDYTLDGKEYMFIGWRLSGSGTDNQVWDPEEIKSKLVFDNNTTGFSSENVSLTAYYVQVDRATQQLITFKTDYFLTAYAINKDEVPLYKKALNSSANTNPPDTQPSKIDGEEGKNYAFKGWAEKWSDEPTVTSDVKYVAALPRATKDAVYTAKYEESVQTYTIKFNYYYRTGNSNEYKYSEESIGIPYGYNPIEIVKSKAVNAFSQNGIQYDLQGWSTRANGEPLSLPVVTGNATYYAIYTQVQLKANVNFYVGGDLYATAANVNVASLLSDAFALTGKANPPAPSGKEFWGWATEKDANTPLDITRQVTGNMSLYAVFGDKPLMKVTFLDDDRQSIIKESYVVVDETITGFGITINTPVKAGSYFDCWVDSNGSPFGIGSEKIINDVKIYASYKPIGKNVASGVSADTTNTYITENTSSAIVNVNKVSQASGNITSVLRANEEVIGAYKLSLLCDYSGIVTQSIFSSQLAAFADISQKIITSGFGSVKLTLPVSESDSTRVQLYLLKEDGSVSSTTKIVSNGVIDISLSDYASLSFEQGNIAVVKTVATTGNNGNDDTGNNNNNNGNGDTGNNNNNNNNNNGNGDTGNNNNNNNNGSNNTGNTGNNNNNNGSNNTGNTGNNNNNNTGNTGNNGSNTGSGSGSGLASAASGSGLGSGSGSSGASGSGLASAAGGSGLAGDDSEEEGDETEEPEGDALSTGTGYDSLFESASLRDSETPLADGINAIEETKGNNAFTKWMYSNWILFWVIIALIVGAAAAFVWYWFFYRKKNLELSGEGIATNDGTDWMNIE